MNKHYNTVYYYISLLHILVVVNFVITWVVRNCGILISMSQPAIDQLRQPVQ
jgi:amino acid permease